LAEFRKLPLSQIDEPPLAMRAEISDDAIAQLKESFALVGQLQPIGVRQLGERYQICFGHTRYLAALGLGWREMDCKVYGADETPEEAAKVAENLVRTEVTPVDEALYFAELYEQYEQDIARVCRAVGRKEDYVADRLRLLEGDEQVREALHKRQISFSVARILNQIGDEKFRRYHLDIAVRHGMTARSATEALTFYKTHHEGKPLPEAREVEVEDAPAAPAPVVACFLCGGHLDPYNMENVWIHKHERAQIEKMLREAAGV